MILTSIRSDVKAKPEGRFQGKMGTLGGWGSEVNFYVGGFCKMKQIT